jgi:ABC-type antimicrobial peptide transport system permease subunit
MTIEIAPTTPTSVPVLLDDQGRTVRGLWGVTVTFFRRQPVGSIGLVLVVIFGLAGIFADWIAPYNPTSNDFAAMTEPPSLAHWLGTDQLGRDLLSRILFGARTAFIVGMTSALVGGSRGWGRRASAISAAYRSVAAAGPRHRDVVRLIIMALAVVSISAPACRTSSSRSRSR